MTDTTHGANKPPPAAPKRKVAGGYHTTTATTNNATQTIAFHVRIKQAVIRHAAWLAVIVRGLQ